MKKNDNHFVYSVPLLHQQGYCLPELPFDFPLSLEPLLPMTHGSIYIMSMLEKIQLELEHLSKSECKVTDIVLASPGRAIHSSIAALAVEADASEPTVNRFCHSMDTRNFPDFRLYLAQSLANGTPYINHSVDKDDSIEFHTGKIFEPVMASLDRIRQSLDSTAVNRTTDLLIQTEKIAFFGLGSSVAVAHDMMNESFRSSVSVIYPDDVVL